MRHPKRISITLASFAAFAAPGLAFAQPAASAAPTVSVTQVAGAEAIAIAGTASPARSLGVTLTTRISEDLPDAVLSRRVITADANGRYAITLPTAPAFIRGALLVVEVRQLPDGATARAVVSVGPPNVPAPPDAVPPSAR